MSAPAEPASPELATLRALRVVASDFAATWAELLWSLPDSYSCHMTCTEANVVTDLFRALGRDIDADAIIAAHMEHDDDYERETHEGERGDLADVADPKHDPHAEWLAGDDSAADAQVRADERRAGGTS
jgi:hypothetical protein